MKGKTNGTKRSKNDEVEQKKEDEEAISSRHHKRWISWGSAGKASRKTLAPRLVVVVEAEVLVVVDVEVLVAVDVEVVDEVVEVLEVVDAEVLEVDLVWLVTMKKTDLESLPSWPLAP